MSSLRTLKKLLLGETWILPLGLAAVMLSCGLVIRPLVAHMWHVIGGFVLLAGVITVLRASVAQGTRRR